LLAGAAATPALAQDNGDGHHHHHGGQQQQDQQGNRGQARQERQQNQAPPQQQQRFNGGQFGAQRYQRAAPQVDERQQVQQWQGRGNFGQRSNGGDDARQQAVQQQVVEQQQQQQQRQAYDRRNRGGYAGAYGGQTQQWQGRNGGYAGTYGGQIQQWQGRNGGYAGTYSGQRQWQQGTRNQGTRYANNWNRNWRNDHHYDWRRYRNSHRSIFQLGIYLDPFGYDYRPYDIGYELPQGYFGQQYWIDPAMYELPYPPEGAVWIRYWNDALLVDTYSGEVIDVIQGFFW
jgi:Ni/Co efflux regulator RcnB